MGRLRRLSLLCVVLLPVVAASPAPAQVAPLTQQASQVTQSTSSQVTQTTQQTVSQVEQTTKQAVSQVEQTTKQAVSQVEQTAQKTLSPITEQAAQLTEQTKSQVTQKTGAVTQEVTKVTSGTTTGPTSSGPGSSGGGQAKSAPSGTKSPAVETSQTPRGAGNATSRRTAGPASKSRSERLRPRSRLDARDSRARADRQVARDVRRPASSPLAKMWEARLAAADRYLGPGDGFAGPAVNWPLVPPPGEPPKAAADRFLSLVAAPLPAVLFGLLALAALLLGAASVPRKALPAGAVSGVLADRRLVIAVLGASIFAAAAIGLLFVRSPVTIF